MSGILTVGLSPAIQQIIRLPGFLPGEVNRSTDYMTDAAGKSINVGRVLVQAGIDTHCLVPLGEDNEELFIGLCKRDGLKIRSVRLKGRVRTCYTLIDLEKKEATEVVVNEPEVISAEEESAFRFEYLRCLDLGLSAVAVSGSRLPGFSSEIIPFMVKEALARGIPFFADYKGEDLLNSFISDQVRPDFVKINDEELADSFPEMENIDLAEKILKLSRKYNNSFIITRGGRSTFYADSESAGELESQIVDAVSPIGCGDSFLAGLLEGVVKKLSLAESIEKGRQYAAWNAESYHPGWIKEGLRK
ncbi:MAG: hypothetical protein JEY99_18345 [Spirochaetales bacterium]|nr:hypothetical protein [Spirochaetales bacterium]